MAQPERYSRGLGWFSIGLGLAQVAAPGGVARLIGVRSAVYNRALLRLIGVRELAAGVGLLSQPRTQGWLWARVGGDVMDLALLGIALLGRRGKNGRVRAAAAMVAGVTVMDVRAAQLLGRHRDYLARQESGPFVLHGSVRVLRPLPEVFDFWRDLQNLPRFMCHLESVTPIDPRRSRWRARAAGMTIEWEAEILQDRPGELIAWRSLPGATLVNEGVVRFSPAPAGRGTDVHVEMRYEPPAGAVGRAVARLLGEVPSHRLREDLRAFREVLETGEVPRSDSTGYFMHPAQPSPRRMEVTP